MDKIIIYINCSLKEENEIIALNEQLSFFTISFEPIDATIMIQIIDDSILINGIDEIFEKNLNLEQLLNQISPLDLSYINKLFSSESERQEMIDLAKKELLINLNELNNAVQNKSPNQIKHFAHKMKSKSSILSMDILSSCDFLEHKQDDVSTQVFGSHLHRINIISYIRLWQLSP